MGLLIRVRGPKQKERERERGENRKEEKRDLGKDQEDWLGASISAGSCQEDTAGMEKQEPGSQGKKTQTAGKEPRGWEVGSHKEYQTIWLE